MGKHAQSVEAEAWNRFADGGRALLVGAAVLAPLWRRDSRSSFDAMTAILATSAACKAIKAFWHEPRPNGQNNNSFPSQHSGECFAAAAILNGVWRDGAGPVAIGVATAVSLARLFGGKHHVVDLVAGGALGIVAASPTSQASARLIAATSS